MSVPKQEKKVPDVGQLYLLKKIYNVYFCFWLFDISIATHP
jgi:hypothetical protein